MAISCYIFYSYISQIVFNQFSILKNILIVATVLSTHSDGNSKKNKVMALSRNKHDPHK